MNTNSLIFTLKWSPITLINHTGHCSDVRAKKHLATESSEEPGGLDRWLFGNGPQMSAISQLEGIESSFSRPFKYVYSIQVNIVLINIIKQIKQILYTLGSMQGPPFYTVFFAVNLKRFSLCEAVLKSFKCQPESWVCKIVHLYLICLLKEEVFDSKSGLQFNFLIVTSWGVEQWQQWFHHNCLGEIKHSGSQ